MRITYKTLVKALITTLLAIIPLLCFSANYKTISLIKKDGTLLNIGQLDITSVATSHNDSFSINLDAKDFQDEFLSMRPFRCLPHQSMTICHLKYPYENRQQISQSDLIDLEYGLLFLFKSPTEYGINPWNGMYFKLKETDSGYQGELFETNLDVLAAPPEKGDLRPISHDELYEPSSNHWITGIKIH